jgi:hypothetical protein
MAVYISKKKISEIEELLARKTRVEFELEVDASKEFAALNKVLEAKIDSLKNELYKEVHVTEAAVDFVERSRNVKKIIYSNMKEELLTSRRPCETCRNYNMFPNGERITDDTIWCAKYPELNPTEDYEMIMKCQESGYEPFLSDKRSQSKADVMLRLILLNNKIEKLENGRSE